MSPEQTGRMNRGVDYRTDFYSLGATFYELLTGLLPFRSNDPLELVHSHIARVPPSPSAIAPGIPGALSSIVMKLLAKTAEERYQSAAGVREDLEICARAWKATGEVPPIILGERDVSDRFLISQRLYGRDHDVSALVEAFEQCCGGPARMTLVAGYSGIGKTSLIRELYAPIVRERAYFISGKFDQVARNIPYGALVQAFRELVQYLLTESDEQIALWRARVGEALGPNGGVIAEVIPEIELILGKQPPPLPLEPTEAQNRFRLVFQNFLAAVAQREHPLVVFLDDLQWADAATLDLLAPLLTGADIRSVFLIGAYRDNEVDAGHPLARTLGALEAAGARLASITLGPLALTDLTLLLRDTLYGELADVEPLAGLIQRKTDGNPFFVIQFLKALREDSLLQFDYERRRWTYQLERIRAAAITDNVVDLMTRKIRRIAPNAQRALTLAACIGNRFDMATLTTVSEQSVDVTAANLRVAIEEGLVVVADRSSELATDLGPSSTGASSRTAYEFLHDRVQQAAYALIPDDQKKLVHLTVGRLLLAACGADVPDDRLFEIVNHLNIGSGLISNAAERLAVARLNLSAGRKAKTSTAYDTAAGYLDRGIALLSDDCWESDYELMFLLHLEAAECHYLARRFDVAEGNFGLLLARALTTLDKAQVHALRIILYENLSHYRQAVSSGREGLSLFGIAMPERDEEAEGALDAEIDTIQRLLGGRAIASLIELPVMMDANVRMVLRILTSLWSNAYIAGNQVLARLISATMVRLSLVHGNTEDSAYGYVTHAITIGPMRGDYQAAYEWGELALKVNERFNDAKRRAKIHQQFHAHVKLWRMPFASCIPHASLQPVGAGWRLATLTMPATARSPRHGPPCLSRTTWITLSANTSRRCCSSKSSGCLISSLHSG
jgi:predicted ATPase